MGLEIIPLTLAGGESAQAVMQVGEEEERILVVAMESSVDWIGDSGSHIYHGDSMEKVMIRGLVDHASTISRDDWPESLREFSRRLREGDMLTDAKALSLREQEEMMW